MAINITPLPERFVRPISRSSAASGKRVRMIRIAALVCTVALTSVLAISTAFANGLQRESPEASLPGYLQNLYSFAYGETDIQDLTDLVVDSAGNIIITGQAFNQINFGGGALNSAGLGDVFLAKFDPNGVHLWSFLYGDATNEIAWGIALDTSDNILITGLFGGNINFGGGALSNAGGGEIFVAKFDPAGAHIWSRAYGGVGEDFGLRIEVDAGDNVFLTGVYGAAIDFGAGPLTHNGVSDVFLAKLNPAGSHIWSQGWGSVDDEQARALVLDATPAVYLAGQFENTVSFGGAGLVSAGDQDIFIAAYDSSGAHQWSRRSGNTAADFVEDATIDNNGNVVVTGGFLISADFGGGALTSNGDADVFLARYDPTGTYLWSQKWGGPAEDYGSSITIDSRGNITMLGVMGGGGVDFGDGVLPHAGLQDIFFVELTSTGAHRMSFSYGDGDIDIPRRVREDPLGDIWFGGSFDSTIDFGTGTLSSLGSLEVFFTKFEDYMPPEPTILSIQDVGIDQGGFVRVNFLRSGYDEPGAPALITRYDLFRRVDPLPAPPTGTGKDTPSLFESTAAWDFIGSVPAHGSAEYNLVAMTLADSTIATGQHWSIFQARAVTSSPFVFYDSPPDSGYSLDNIPPCVPTFIAMVGPGFLTWDDSPDEDFDFFTVYGSSKPVFDETASMIGTTPVPALNVQATPFGRYYVTATDEAGNEGEAGEITPATGIGDPLLRARPDLEASPNPFNPSTTIRYSVRQPGLVTLALFDVGGRQVNVLLDREYRTVGTYRLKYHASLASGVYLLRLTTPAGTHTKKVTLLK